MRNLSLICKQALLQIKTHTRPWIIRYILNLGTAGFFSVAITLSMWKLLSQPYITTMLEQRSLDILFDVLLNMGKGENNVLLGFIITAIAVAAWLPMQIVFLWLEGGILASYASEARITWKAFLSACNRWFWFMLLLRSIYVLIAAIILTGILVSGLLLRILWPPLMWFVFTAGALLFLLLSLWIEVIGAVAITSEKQHLRDAVLNSTYLFKHIPGPLFAFYGLSLCAMAILLSTQRWLSVNVPITAWLMSFILLQILAFTRHGVRLYRRSGEVIIAQSLADSKTFK